MFTGMLQNLLNSSGQAAAVQRASQLSNYVQNKQQTEKSTAVNIQTKAELDKLYGETELNTFEDVMNSSLNVHTRFNVNKPKYDINFGKLTVQAHKINRTADAINQLTEAQAASSAVKISEKSQIKDLISKISKKHGVDEKLVHAVIKQESGYNPNAKSSAGAEGLMQLMPSTAKFLGVTDPFNPAQNIDGGVRYLKSMLERYNGSIPLALAAYNAGPGNVDKYDNIPPFKETQNYVKNILADYL